MYFFRIVPEGDEWLCKRGAQILQRCDTVVDAIDGAEAEALIHRPAEVLYHSTDGDVTVIGRFLGDDPQPP